MLVRDDSWGRNQLSRRRKVKVSKDIEGFAAHPEDIILAKLLYYKEGGSDKHLRDIASMLQVTGYEIDQAQVQYWARQLHVESEWEAALDWFNNRKD